MKQNRPTPSISLGLNYFKNNKTKEAHHTNQDTTLIIYIYIYIYMHTCVPSWWTLEYPIVYIIYIVSKIYIPRNIILNKEPHKYQTYHNKLHYHIGDENQKSW